MIKVIQSYENSFCASEDVRKNSSVLKTDLEGFRIKKGAGNEQAQANWSKSGGWHS